MKGLVFVVCAAAWLAGRELFSERFGERSTRERHMARNKNNVHAVKDW